MQKNWVLRCVFGDGRVQFGTVICYICCYFDNKTQCSGKAL